MPKEHRDFSLRRRTKPLTPEKLMSILDQTEGGKRARQAYKQLTGLSPPEDAIDVEEGEQDGINNVSTV